MARNMESADFASNKMVFMRGNLTRISTMATEDIFLKTMISLRDSGTKACGMDLAKWFITMARLKRGCGSIISLD